VGGYAGLASFRTGGQVCCAPEILSGDALEPLARILAPLEFLRDVHTGFKTHNRASPSPSENCLPKAYTLQMAKGWIPYFH
jgi:hypothetical protein